MTTTPLQQALDNQTVTCLSDGFLEAFGAILKIKPVRNNSQGLMEMQALFSEFALPLGQQVRLVFTDHDVGAVVWLTLPQGQEEFLVTFLYHPTAEVVLPQP